MDTYDEKLDALIMYLRAYKQVLRDPNAAGFDTQDELEDKIKPLFVDLMGYSAALREKEEKEKGQIDARLKHLLNERIGERTMEASRNAIKGEMAEVKRLIGAIPKTNPGEKEIKANLRKVEEGVKAFGKALNDLSHKPINVNLVESETMASIERLRKQVVPPEEGDDDIYITYPANGQKKEVSVGTLVIDFFTGEVTLPDGTTEHASNRLENTDFNKVKSLSVDVNKAAVITLDSGGKYPIGANQLFSIERQKFRTAYIAITETTDATVWASTNKEGAIRVEKPSTIDTDERRYTTRIEYDGSNNPIYVGEAETGSGETELEWRIKKLTYSGSNVTQIDWCSGSESFRFAWSSRTSYTYS